MDCQTHGGRRKTQRSLPSHRLFALQDTLLESLGNARIPRRLRVCVATARSPLACPSSHRRVIVDAPFAELPHSSPVLPPAAILVRLPPATLFRHHRCVRSCLKQVRKSVTPCRVT